VTREFALAGFIAVGFAIASFYATDRFGWFGYANLLLGSLSLVVAAVAGARRLRRLGGAASHRVIARGLCIILVALVAAVGSERLAARAKIQFDWTFEGAFEPSPATLKALRELPEEVAATLYYDPFDPRVRRTRLLLTRIAEEGPMSVRERILDDHPEETDRFEVGVSNTVVLRLGDRFETIERPTEGTIYEALYRLRSVEGGTVTALRGEGEGDLSRTNELGYAGLAAAIATEGYDLRSVATATMAEVPEPTDVLLVISPRRRLRNQAIAAIRRYLDRGGSLVAFLEPGVDSGIEELLAEFGISSPDAVVVDPDADRSDAPVAGLNILAYSYWHHPITRGLDRNRMTYFAGARSFELRKPRIEDELSKVVESSPYSWLEEDVSVLDRNAGVLERDGREQSYHSLVVSGRYRRGDRETRIVALGDADLASNQHLRTLYNLDLVLNAVHWAAENEPEITLRPKNRPTPVQFPVPLTNSLRTLYGVGLLVPELLLIAGGIIWLRRRSA
jgi:hypothetical protein